MNFLLLMLRALFQALLPQRLPWQWMAARRDGTTCCQRDRTPPVFPPLDWSWLTLPTSFRRVRPSQDKLGEHRSFPRGPGRPADGQNDPCQS